MNAPDPNHTVSVYCEDTGQYKYYRVSNGAGRPRRYISRYGYPVRDALPKLPPDAKYYGSGPSAIGSVVLPQSAILTSWKVAGAALAVLGGLFLWRSRKPS